MIETMDEKLKKLVEEEPGITSFTFAVKCKTSDGMIYTLEEIVSRKSENQLPNLPLWAHANSDVVKSVLCHMERVDEGGFIYSYVENVAIKAKTIIRIWAEMEFAGVDEQEEYPMPKE